MVAIEFGTCRSGRNGGSSGSVTFGYDRLREQPGGARSRGGNRLRFGDQETVGGDAHGGVMVKAEPSASFEMPEADLLLELLIVALDAPAQLGGVDKTAERDGFSARSKASIWWVLSHPRATRSAATPSPAPRKARGPVQREHARGRTARTAVHWCPPAIRSCATLWPAA